MRKTIITFIVIIFTISVFGNPIDRQTALTIANNFYTQVDKTSKNLVLAYECTTYQQSEMNKDGNTQVYYYVFNSTNGFVIISGDDAVYPVLGYTKTGTFNSENLPDNFRKWLETYKKQISYVVNNDIKATDAIKADWKAITNNQYHIKSTKSGNPLLTTTWNQSPYFNDLCPYDVEAGSERGYHAVTGCPATAMAQIMKFWNYPKSGTGFHSYNHDIYGNLSANFGSTTYDWLSMPNNVTSANTAVATIMYHCGVAVEMGYGPKSSGSYVIIDGYPKEQTCEYAYKTYFGYDPTSLKGLRRINYSDNEWKQLLKNDLDAGRPIQYAGFGEGGHTFVCDAYDSNDYFHMNWGWGGQDDGFFMIDALNPGVGGTGAGGRTYNQGQQALIGIQPPANQITYDMDLHSSLTISSSTINYGQGFSVNANISNKGSNTFNGDYGAAIFDDDFNFIEFLEIKKGYSLEGGYYYSNGINFSTTGILAVLPGTYHISLFYRPTSGDWSIIHGSTYPNSVQLNVVNKNEITLYSNIIVSSGDIVQNEAFDVSLSIANYSTTDFSGTFSISLYDIETGNFIENIGTKTNMSLPAGYYDDGLTFHSSGINTEPGTYLLAVSHQRDGQNVELTGFTTYKNPVKVIVKIPEIEADTYESNDSETQAYNIPISFSSNTINIQTTGSNNHTGSDLDYYKIVLPIGADYTITARVHDNFNSGNGQIYTNDVGWSYLYNNTWSEVYDDIMVNSFTVKNGGNLIFNVSPYFIGSKGTYLLDINIT